MSQIFRIQRGWTETILFQRTRRRIRDAIIASGVILLSWFINIWLFYAVLVIASLFLLAEFSVPNKSQTARNLEGTYIEISELGLMRSTPHLSGSGALSVLTPWHVIKVVSVKRRDGKLHNIRLKDLSLPKGVRTIDLVHYESMEKLFSEIKLRVRDGT